MRMRFFMSSETNVRNCKMCIDPLFNIGRFLTPNIRAIVSNGSQQVVNARPFTEISVKQSDTRSRRPYYVRLESAFAYRVNWLNGRFRRAVVTCWQNELKLFRPPPLMTASHDLIIFRSSELNDRTVGIAGDQEPVHEGQVWVVYRLLNRVMYGSACEKRR